MHRKFFYFMIGIGISLMFVFLACTTKQAYVGLGAARDSYKEIMTDVHNLNKEGKLSEDQLNDIRAYHDIYVSAHNSAVRSLKAFSELQTDDAEQKYLEAVRQMNLALLDLMKMVRQELERQVNQ